MLQHSAELGGNAVVGARYDATEVMQGVKCSPTERQSWWSPAGERDRVRHVQWLTQ